MQPGNPAVRIAVDPDQQPVLAGELDGIIKTTIALYHQVGREWDPADSANTPPDVAPIVRARAQLTGPGPWHLEGGVAELRFMLGRLRAGAELALQRGRQPGPAPGSVAMRAHDAEGMDQHLDILGVCDALMAQLPTPGAG